MSWQLQATGSETRPPYLGVDAGGRKSSTHRKRQVDGRHYLGDTSASVMPSGRQPQGSPLSHKATWRDAAGCVLCDTGQTRPGSSLRGLSAPVGTASLWGEGRLWVWAVADTPTSTRPPPGRDALNTRPVEALGPALPLPRKFGSISGTWPGGVSPFKGTVFCFITFGSGTSCRVDVHRSVVLLIDHTVIVHESVSPPDRGDHGPLTLAPTWHSQRGLN